MPTHENSYALTIPTEDSDNNVWGGLLNDNILMYAAMHGGFATLTIDTVAAPNNSVYTAGTETLDWILQDSTTADGTETFDQATRYPFVELTDSGDLGATQIINVCGNDATTAIDRVMVIKNSLSGSQSLELRNGGNANASPFLILNGQARFVSIRSGTAPVYIADVYDGLNLVASDLTAVGDIRLDGNYPSTGSANTAIGINAMNTSATGTKNVAVGQNALTALVGGDRNIAIGDNALVATTEGDYNIAIGSQAMSDATTTSNFGNVCIGRQSGQNLENDADNNVFIGYQSGKAATTDSGNVCVGALAGTTITTGASNFIFGPGASITTGSNNIIVGSAALHGLGATTSNQFAIGGAASNYAILGGILSQNSLTSESDSDIDNFTITNKHATFSNSTLVLEADRVASTAYNFIEATADADGTPNLVFKVRGDGEVTADGSFTGGGADYAEMFEWADGNPDEEDREGRTVILVDGKIVLASKYYRDFPRTTDEVIGAISACPSIVGNNPLNWPGMFKKDALGRNLDEVSDGYDEEQEYIHRRRRKEWAVVGLVGRIPIYKNQAVGKGWKKIKNISDEAEEWLVR